jgi:hypothetical protein
LQTFEAHRAEWIRAGKTRQWVAVFQQRVLGLPTLDASWDFAVREFGNHFMVKRIFEQDRPAIVSNFEMAPPED